MDELKTKKDYIRRYDRLISWDEEDKIYIVKFPELPGCATHGETLKEAFEMGDEAASAYLSALDEQGLPYPLPNAIAKGTKQFALRLDMPTFQFIKLCADEAGISINEAIAKRLNDPNFRFYAKTSPAIRKKVEEHEKITEAKKKLTHDEAVGEIADMLFKNRTQMKKKTTKKAAAKRKPQRAHG